ncbi:hypothetical protein SDC9_202279 [bioreactor metagenome]|uniref:Uncharacterized protein n=1 Tax=bioreactor metagenome TaxID=1076179 RepID=A0A645IT88_9ZZZZ
MRKTPSADAFIIWIKLDVQIQDFPVSMFEQMFCTDITGELVVNPDIVSAFVVM